MAGPLQGDIVNISKLAWDVYRFGWDKDFNAARQYAEFGRDVRGLAENLDTLGLVVIQADKSLRSEGAFSRAPRWDPSSLGEIIGDYESTLQECVELIKNNNRHRLGGGPLRYIEWNVLVAPSADRLRARIALHNSKVLHVLKPFEIDLLCRVREDIHMVHRDLAQRIQAVHGDLHRLMGVLVPDLEKELEQQARRELHSLEMPPVVKQGLQKAWTNRFTDDPGLPSLQDMTNAFVTHFNKSTVNFSPLGILVENKIPPLELYVNLLKCIWIKEQILESPQLRQITPGVSHWPSFIQELGNTLSTQCGRFQQDLVQPSIAGLTQGMLDIWPEKPLPQLVDVVTQSALMEKVLDVQLQGPTATVQKKLQLLRRMGAEERPFRINISGMRQGTSRSQTETIDFDISTVILNPLYAMPSKSGALDMILRKDERIAKLSFTALKDVVKFQQAVTGFKAFDRYCQYNAMVSFVVSGRDEPLVEDACVQLWVPKQLDGQLVTDNEAQASGNAKSRSFSPSSSAYKTTSRQGSVSSILSPPEHFPGSPTETISTWDNISPLEASASRGSRIPSPPALNAMNPLASRPPISIARRPVGSGSSQSTLLSPPGGSRQPTLSTPPSSPPSSSLFPGWPSAARAPFISTANSRPDRTFSVSSVVSTTTPPSTDSSGNASEAHTATVSIEGHTTGTVHRRPPQPMIVLFTQNRATRRMALVTVDIDEETAVNPDRCNCRRSGSDGASCAIAAVEQKSGKLELSARRFESRDGDTDWNIAKLALERRREKEYAAAYWKNVRRISIMFPTAEGRAKFGGTPNKCQCKARTEGEHFNCLKTGHKGHLGLVQEYARQQLNEYHRARYVSQQDVVRGMRDDYQLVPSASHEKTVRLMETTDTLQQTLEGHSNSVRVLGDDHPSKLPSMANLASVRSNQGRCNKVEELGPGVADELSETDANLSKMREIATAVTRSLGCQRLRNCQNCLPNRAAALVKSGSCQDHIHPFQIILSTNWKPYEFLNTHFNGKPPSKIGPIVTYTGLVSSAFATMCSEYLRVTWPRNGSNLLNHLEVFLKEPTPQYLKEKHQRLSVKAISTKASIRLFLSEKDSLIVEAEGTASMLTELAQQVAWLTSALQLFSWPEKRATYYYADVDVLPEQDTSLQSSVAQFTVLSRFEEVSPSEKSCWLDLVSHGTVIARGFPVPDRDTARGLEIPLPILVEMAGIRHVVEFREGVVMKGLSSMLLPISRTDDIIQWHLVSAPPDADRLTYQTGIDLCKNRAMLDEVPLDSIAKSRAVVGWCRRAVSRLGSEDVAYDNIDYSDAKESPAVINVSSVALGIQQIGMGQIEFTIGARHARSHFKREGTYAHLLNVAARIKVLLYDTRERRAWLVGADEVILHIIRKKQSMEPFLSDGQDVRIKPAETVKQTLLSNRTLILMEDDEKPETLRDMVWRLFSLFEFLIDENVKRDTSPEMRVSTHAGSELSGYEFMAVAEEHSPYHRKHCSILKTSGGWTSLVEACDALVLFASGFEDLICPAKDALSLCHKYGTVPKDNDYMTTRVALLMELYVAAGCKLTRECLSSSGLRWHCEASLFEDCTSPGSFRCSCNRLQRIVPKTSLRTIEKPGHLDDDGAVIFGRSSERGTSFLPSRQRKGTATLYQHPNIALAPALTSQRLKTPVEESSCCKTDLEDNVYDTAAIIVSSSEKPCKT